MSPTRSHRHLLAPVTALLLAVAVAGCHRSTPPEDARDTRERPTESGANVLDSDEMNLSGVNNMEELIVGKLPGVDVRRAGGRLSVIIRGQSTFSGSNEALIVVDGFQSNGRQLMAMNPGDVERIEVLKGPAAATYGVRGANGVLLITTRRNN